MWSLWPPPKAAWKSKKWREETPHLIHKVALDPLTGPMPYQGRELQRSNWVWKVKLVQQFTKIFMGLATIFRSATWR
nr:hypothetical protein [Escherichia coli]